MIAEQLTDEGRFGSFARGLRPYDVAVCIEGEDELVICHGAHRGGDPAELYEVEQLPQIASFEPADGQLTGSTPIVIRMNRPFDEAGGESPSFRIVRTIDGETIDQRPAWDAATGVLTITPVEPWEPGVQVRIEAGYAYSDRHAETWLYLDTPVPVARFRVGAAPRLDDPRDLPPRFACDLGGTYARANDGLCTRVQLHGPGTAFGVPIDLPYDRARASADPWLEHPDGTVVPSSAGVIAGVFQLTWPSPLEGNTRYELVLPADAKNLVGSPFHPDDRRLGFMTSVPLPAIISTVPAAGATGVDRIAALAVAFNTPVTFPAGAVSLTTGATSVPLSLVQTGVASYELLHDPLAPLTIYTLTFTAQIYNADLAPLTGAPVAITFTTGG